MSVRRLYRHQLIGVGLFFLVLGNECCFDVERNEYDHMILIDTNLHQYVLK